MSDKSVFISYNRENVEEALRLYIDLKQAGFEPWLDRKNLSPGQKWKPTLKKAINDSRFFIALFSSKLLPGRRFFYSELKAALDILDIVPETDIYLIPARLDDCEPPDDRLLYIQWVDMFPSWDAGINKILSSMGQKNIYKIITDEEEPQRNYQTILAQQTINDSGPKLEVTDIIVDSYRPDFAAVLDFRLINQGDKSLTISRVWLNVVEVKEIYILGALSCSGTYSVDISNLRQKGDQVEIVVSQVLAADEADRFTITLTAKRMNMSKFMIWWLKPILVTSEGLVEAPGVSVGLPWDIRNYGLSPRMK